MSMQCMNAWLQQFWGSTLRTDLYAVCDPSSKKEERRSWSVCRKPYHNHKMWWAERYQRQVASKQVSRSWACFPSFYNQAFWDPNENAKQMTTWDDWQKSRGTVNAIITFTRATIALGQCMMWRLNLAQMVMLYRQQTPSQACTHLPHMQANKPRHNNPGLFWSLTGVVMVVQLQKAWWCPWSALVTDTVLICWHAQKIEASGHWHVWGIILFPNLWIWKRKSHESQSMGKASSESWSLGILFSQSLDLERKKKAMKHSTICDHTLKQNFMKVLLPMCKCPILLLLCCCIWESK